MARGWERPPAWSVMVIVAGAVFLAVATPIALGRGQVSQADVERLNAEASANAATAEPASGPTLDLAAVERALFIGDSWTFGTAADPVARGFAYLTAEELGVEAEVHGYGSVGYVNPGRDGGGTFQQRFEREQVAADPDLVVLQGSQNDIGEDVAGVGSAARSLVDYARGRWPDAQIVILGPAPPTAGVAAGLPPVRDALASVAGDAGVPFIDPLAGGWMNGDAFERLVTPTDPHLNTEGHAYFAGRFAEALRMLGR